MKKIVLVFITFASLSAVFAQDKKKEKKKTDLANRAGDHIMLQMSYDRWFEIPDSIKNHQNGFSRGGNIYVMMDKPFKGNPRFSAAFGIGVATSNMYFERYSIDIKSTTIKLPFNSLDTLDHFKKYKLATAFVDVPIELRFTANPEKNNKSIKAALGFKVGALMSVHTKGKTLQNRYGNTINDYTEKESAKRYFNTTRIAVTGRFGYGNFSIFSSYQINNLLKDGVGPPIKPFQIGICLSGL